MAHIDSEHGKTKLTLFSDVEPTGAVGIVISTAEKLAEDGVVSVCIHTRAFASNKVQAAR